MEWKKITEKPEGSFMVILKKNPTISWFQIRKLVPYVIILISVCTINIQLLFSRWKQLAFHWQQLYSKCLPSPVRQKEGTDVGYRWSSRPKLRQCHDVLEGDVRLRADIHYTHVLRRAAVVMCNSSRGSGGGSPENLDNDGFPPDGLHHRLLMVNFGEVPCIHLVEDDTKSLGHPVLLHVACYGEQIQTIFCPSIWIPLSVAIITIYYTASERRSQ